MLEIKKSRVEAAVTRKQSVVYIASYLLVDLCVYLLTIGWWNHINSCCLKKYKYIALLASFHIFFPNKSGFGSGNLKKINLEIYTNIKSPEK